MGYRSLRRGNLTLWSWSFLHCNCRGRWRLNLFEPRRFRRCGRLLRKAIDARLRFGDDLVVLFGVLEKVGDVQESVAFETDVDEGRLHARQHAIHAALVNSAHQADIRVALELTFNQIADVAHVDLRLVCSR